MRREGWRGGCWMRLELLPRYDQSYLFWVITGNDGPFRRLLSGLVIQNWWHLYEKLHMAALYAPQSRQTNHRYSLVALLESVVSAKLANEWLAMQTIPLRSNCLFKCANGALQW